MTATAPDHRAIAERLSAKGQRCDALADSLDRSGRLLAPLPEPVLALHTSAVWNSRAADQARNDLTVAIQRRFNVGIDDVHSVARRLREQADEHSRAAARHGEIARQIDRGE